MTSINVLFELPQYIINGLANGTYERVGGVIRKATGKKTVVAWLTEMSGSVGEKSNTSFSSVFTNERLMMGMQAANLAVSVAGFAIMNYKLGKIEDAVHNLSSKIERLSSAQAWMDEKSFIANLAPITSSVKSLDTIHLLENKETARNILINSDDNFSISKEYFKGVISRMLIDNIESERPEEFALHYRAWMMANQASINTMLALEELPLALQRINTIEQEHKVFGNKFLEYRSDIFRRIQCESKSINADLHLKLLGQQMAGAHEILQGQALQLEAFEKMDIPRSFLNFKSEDNKNAYALLTIEN